MEYCCWTPYIMIRTVRVFTHLRVKGPPSWIDFFGWLFRGHWEVGKLAFECDLVTHPPYTIKTTCPVEADRLQKQQSEIIVVGSGV